MEREFARAILIQADIQAPRMPCRHYTKEKAIRIRIPRTVPRHMQAEGSRGHVKHALITYILMGLHIPERIIQEALEPDEDLANRQPTGQE